jgi:hypothetical protein
MRLTRQLLRKERWRIRPMVEGQDGCEKKPFASRQLSMGKGLLGEHPIFNQLQNIPLNVTQRF